MSPAPETNRDVHVPLGWLFAIQFFWLGICLAVVWWDAWFLIAVLYFNDRASRSWETFRARWLKERT